jgi:hypothetical protein
MCELQQHINSIMRFGSVGNSRRPRSSPVLKQLTDTFLNLLIPVHVLATLPPMSLRHTVDRRVRGSENSYGYGGEVKYDSNMAESVAFLICTGEGPGYNLHRDKG